MRADSGLVEQLRCELSDERLDFSGELAFLGRQALHTTGDRAQR